MYKQVVIKAFEKAKKDIHGRSNKTNMSEHISNVLMDDFRHQISGKTLRNLFDESNNAIGKVDISISSNYVQYLCDYLGFENYNAFLKANPEAVFIDNHKVFLGFIKNNKVVLSISCITIVIVFAITTLNKQRWMIWDENHYVEVPFDAEQQEVSKLKLYNAERIEKFQKIEPDCQTKFFNESGNAIIWYGKNQIGELEYFTAIAKHPETGKTLKAITPYMVKKHICEGYH